MSQTRRPHRPLRWRGRAPALGAGLLATALTMPEPRAHAGRPPDAVALELPDRYGAAPEASVAASDRPWWQRFGDPELDRLVSAGLTENFDVQSARSRIDEADAVVQQQLAALLPTLSWDTQAQIAPTESLGFQFGGLGGMGPAPKPIYLTWSTALNARIELDLSGRNVQAKRAAEHDAAAAAAELDAQRVALASQIANAYYDIVAAREQLEAIERQIEIARELLAVTTLRFEGGSASAVEVLQQEQQLAAAESLEPPASALVRTYEQRLSVLVADQPGTRYQVAAQLPEVGPTPPLGSPDDLGRHRPELRAAQERLAASRARRKNANRQFAPTLSVSGALGYQGFYLDRNTPGSDPYIDQTFWNAGAALSVPLYSGGRKVGQIRQTRAAENTAMYALNQSTLRAVQEVEEAIVQEEGQRKAVEAWKRNLAAAEAAYAESRSRYQEGGGDYLAVLAAVDARRAAALNLINAQRQLVGARITLHAALGDAWRDRIGPVRGDLQ